VFAIFVLIKGVLFKEMAAVFREKLAQDGKNAL
jgi:hypothetical protein